MALTGNPFYDKILLDPDLFSQELKKSFHSLSRQGGYHEFIAFGKFPYKMAGYSRDREDARTGR